MLIARDLPNGLRQEIPATIIAMRDSEAGRQALAAMSYSGFRKARPEEFELLRPYLEHALQLSQEGSRN